MASIANGLNMTLGLNLTSILTFPSKLVSRMRRVDEDWFASIKLVGSSARRRSQSEQPSPLSKIEPPWASLGFFTSKYVIGLFLMGIVLHRIQNIILPSVNRSRNRPLLNLSSSTTRLILHIPTIALLARTLAIWSITLLQTAYLLPSPTPIWAAWVTSMSFGSICWWTFLSICSSFALDSLIRVLSINSTPGDNAGLLILENFMLQAGGGGALAGHPGGGGAPFNLVGYAFLLHVYSNPLTHLFSPEGSDSPTRPDMHTVMTIGIPLIQVTLLHVIQIYKPWSNYRLIPTAVSSVLSLVHFHGTLWAWPVAWSPSRPPLSPLASHRNAPTGFPQYPLLNYIPSILETTLLFTICLTLFLNCLAQFIVSGRIQNLSIGLGFGRTEAVITEDFPVLLLRLGTASLEHSGSGGIRGWSNEGPNVDASLNPGEFGARQEYGAVRMARDGSVMVLTRGVTNTAATTSASSISPSSRNRKRRCRKSRVLRGWGNEIRSVSMIEGEHDTGGWSWLKCIVGNWAIIKEMYVFLNRGVYGVMKKVWRRSPPLRRDALPESQNTPGFIQPHHTGTMDSDIRESSEELYEKFKMGEIISDDDDSDWVESTPSQSDIEEDGQGEGEGEGEGEEGGGDHHSDNPMSLIHDLRSPSPSSRQVTPEPHHRTVPILMAHMASPSSKGALTRRRYRSLFPSTSSSLSSAYPSTAVSSSSHAHPQSSSIHSTNHNHQQQQQHNHTPIPPPAHCVVCISSPREIICWPCRCLTVCDECRDSLASGAASGSGAARCPCCRRVVEGYSRIYIP